MTERVIVTLGDSLTEGSRWDELDTTAKVINFGLSGDTALGLYFRLNRVALAKPSLIFLQIGINDLSQGREPEELVKAHRRIWETLAGNCPLAQLVVCSLAPVRESKFLWVAQYLTNARVRETNDLLVAAAREARLNYVDLYEPLADPNRELYDRFTTDGVHLTPAAYEVWLKTLKDFLNGLE
ncbi:MAG: GDSL-type esterase/lipase family protein [Deltaproteobacteria bacterium]|jgi:lysophospholipase L1-like esterase|nr:GDSL-type esterase/lipase family protein [Deltaproteobacteria bacterium]